MPITVAIDAASVFEAIVADPVKVPAEKSLFLHLLWVRELLSRGQLCGWSWIDTRDMIADGLTKGSVERAALHALMSGKFYRQHAAKLWSPAHATRVRELH